MPRQPIPSRDQGDPCRRLDAVPDPVADSQKVGISLNVRDGALPINGLRHRPVGDTTGWYIWAGDLLGDDDFFQPVHVGHLDRWCPDVRRYLALPPGWRFPTATRAGHALPMARDISLFVEYRQSGQTHAWSDGAVAVARHHALFRALLGDPLDGGPFPRRGLPTDLSPEVFELLRALAETGVEPGPDFAVVLDLLESIERRLPDATARIVFWFDP